MLAMYLICGNIRGYRRESERTLQAVRSDDLLCLADSQSKCNKFSGKVGS